MYGLCKRHKTTYSHICETALHHEEHALYKNNFTTGNGELSKIIAGIKAAA